MKNCSKCNREISSLQSDRLGGICIICRQENLDHLAQKILNLKSDLAAAEAEYIRENVALFKPDVSILFHRCQCGAKFDSFFTLTAHCEMGDSSHRIWSAPVGIAVLSTGAKKPAGPRFSPSDLD